jgi:hypothetical protein
MGKTFRREKDYYSDEFVLRYSKPQKKNKTFKIRHLNKDKFIEESDAVNKITTK